MNRDVLQKTCKSNTKTEQEKKLATPKNRTVPHINLNSNLRKENVEQCYMESKT